MSHASICYIMGPSGVGKDTLLARVKDAQSDQWRIARRFITRPVDYGGEDHVALTESDFDTHLAAGDFSLHWTAHGVRYGIGREIDAWIDAGLLPIISGSRAAWPMARDRYENAFAIQITARPETIAKRLHDRGRENAHGIAERVRRAAEFELLADQPVIWNDGTPEEGYRQLYALMSTKAVCICRY